MESCMAIWAESLSPTRVHSEYELEPRTIRAAFTSGELAATEIKRKLFVRREELERWIRQREARRVPKAKRRKPS